MASQRVPASTWRERIAQWRSSGMPAQEYAQQQGYPLERLTFWTRRIERETHGPQLLPVQVRMAPAMSVGIELRSQSGWSMRVGADIDPSWLAAVLSGLR